jgi:5-hydroxyisourate hydrolase-like protein (transthyretin family)
LFSWKRGLIHIGNELVLTSTSGVNSGLILVRTNEDGRVKDFPRIEAPDLVYKITFQTAAYHERVGQSEYFYPYVEVTFK